MKLGLDGTRELLAALAHPEARFAAVHVAGTNGKGSVCALVERVLRAAGLRTGLYTSPHLVDFRERIRVNGRWPSETALAERLDAIAALASENAAHTFFEVATALAFDHFARARASSGPWSRWGWAAGSTPRTCCSPPSRPSRRSGSITRS